MRLSYRRLLVLGVLSSSIGMVGCGMHGTDPASPPAGPPPPPPPASSVSVSISPGSSSLTIGQSLQFAATVSNTTNTAVTWSVNGTAGGNSTVGTISAAGQYTAPGKVPSAPISISATSVADGTKSATASVTVNGYSGMLSWHNDLSITGQNLKETALNTSNVNQNLFGKLFSYSLDGQSFAQPLYVANVPIPGQGTHNVIYVGTEHDTVYAFDADKGGSGPLWSVNFTNPGAGITTVPAADVGGGGPIAPEVGITGTPVIDGSTGTLYVVAATKENGAYFHRLHALDITSGKEKFGGPAVIKGSVSGTGWGSNNGQIAFQSVIQLQRCALLLSNGVVYVAFASYNDLGLYHGWVMGYDASTLLQTTIWNSTPDGQKGGIWLSGAPLSADSSGNIFVVVGNGTFDADSGGDDYGDSFVKLTPNGNTLSISDYFTPFDQATLAANDIDLGSSGFTLLPDQPGAVTHLGVSAGKSGKIYLLNRDNMGKFQSGSDSQIVQSISNALGTQANDNAYSTAVYWQNNVYFVGSQDVLKQFQLSNGQLSVAPIKNSHVYGYPGANMCISANGSSNGILWVIEASGMNVLHAYDATNVSNELYNSNQAPNGRDQFGIAVRFTTPTAINGKVYVAGQTQLAVFGLL
jgi:hypothetical protein